MQQRNPVVSPDRDNIYKYALLSILQYGFCRLQFQVQIRNQCMHHAVDLRELLLHIFVQVHRQRFPLSE